MIDCVDISVGYENKPIVTNLSFYVKKGDFLSIVGENGSGKSTLMKTLLGLLPPVSGKISFDEGLKKNCIGYLPQQTVVQKDFPASVFEITVSGFQGKCGMRPYYNKSEKAAAMENLKKMGMDGFASRCYRELSGGQQQRVLLARALCATQALLLLDEPVTGLDPNATAEMYALIEELNVKQGITVIMISHDMDAALKYSNRILHLGNERIFGSKEDFAAFLNKKGGAI